MADKTPTSYSADPALYLYTSLTAGSSHIITATSRLETILKANKIAFKALDVATDEKARMLWGRRSKGKKLPGLVKFGSIIGDLEEIEEWNEYGELKQQIGSTSVAGPTPTASATGTPSKAPAVPVSIPGVASTLTPDEFSQLSLTTQTKEDVGQASTDASKKGETPLSMAMRQAGFEAAIKAGEKKVLKSATPGDPIAPKAAIETKMAKAMEEHGTSAEVTAGKIPEKLAEEGAKRTSVDKIAEEDVKRTKSEAATQLDGASVQGHPGPSQAATRLELRRTSSTTKVKSPLSEEAAATSSSDLEAMNLESKPKPVQGSTVPNLSKEETQEIEKRDAILEEDTDEPSTKDGAPNLTASSTYVPSSAQEVGDSVSAIPANVTATNEGEAAATKDVRPQEQDPKDPTGANVSVGD